VLCSSKDIFIDAEEKKYAVGAFNISNLEVLQAVVEAAEETRSSAIIALSESAIEYGGFENLVKMTGTAAENSRCAFAVHLDHGQNRDLITRCIKEGFSSVMFDGSSMVFDDNAAATRDVVDQAHKYGVSVEGELGRLVGIEDNIKVSAKEGAFTDPKQAKRFVELTGVDSLAVAVGTSHGAYKFKGKASLDFEKLKEINELVDIPLVLHGASGVSEEAVSRALAAGVDIEGARGVSDEAIKRAIGLGVRKINIDTDIRLAFTTALRETLQSDRKLFDPRKIFSPVKDAVRAIVKNKMELFKTGK